MSSKHSTILPCISIWIFDRPFILLYLIVFDSLSLFNVHISLSSTDLPYSHFIYFSTYSTLLDCLPIISDKLLLLYLLMLRSWKFIFGLKLRSNRFLMELPRLGNCLHFPLSACLIVDFNHHILFFCKHSHLLQWHLASFARVSCCGNLTYLSLLYI